MPTSKPNDRRVPIGPVALLLLLAAAASLSRLVRAAPEMFELRTEHYRVETDISPEFGRIVGAHMESIFGEYARRFQGYGEMDVTFNVAVYRRERDYLRRVPADVRGSTGVFVSSQRLLAAHAEDRTPEEVLRTLYHEGFHQFAYFVVSEDLPIWLNEGLAEYFSEATWNGQGFVLGQVPALRLHIVREALRDGTVMRFGELFALDPDEWLQNVRTDYRRASLHYCQSWAVVHFLLHADGGAYAPRMNHFLRQLNEGEDDREAFTGSFGVDLAGFERAWANYMATLQPGPKFVCRDNMEAIMLLAGLFHNDARDFDSVSALRRQALHGPYRWEITSPTGQALRSSDSEAVRRLFHCPYHTDSGEISYVVVRDNRTGGPVLVCIHHPGIIMKAYYSGARRGGPKVAVEEQVRETVGPDLQRAIMAATR